MNVMPKEYTSDAYMFINGHRYDFSSQRIEQGVFIEGVLLNSEEGELVNYFQSHR